MAKNYFCEYCGCPLKVTRKALKNKGIIIELVSAHECDEKFLENITDASKPASATARELADLEKNPPKEDDNAPPRKFPDPGDHRSDIKSTAPVSVIDKVKTQSNSTPEHDLED